MNNRTITNQMISVLKNFYSNSVDLRLSLSIDAKIYNKRDEVLDPNRKGLNRLNYVKTF